MIICYDLVLIYNYTIKTYIKEFKDNMVWALQERALLGHILLWLREVLANQPVNCTSSAMETLDQQWKLEVSLDRCTKGRQSTRTRLHIWAHGDTL
jgi:hypothetical protein